jgi:hypothetical protein
MLEDPQVSLLIALRVLSEQQSPTAQNHMAAVALLRLAESDQERTMSLKDLARAVIARRRSSDETHASSEESDNLLPLKKPPAIESLKRFSGLRAAR